MKIEKYDGKEERNILTAMIVNRRVLARVASSWRDEGLFASRWSNIIGSCCIDFFRRHNKAPKKAVDGIVLHKMENSADEHTLKLVNSYLDVLSTEWESRTTELNPDCIMDEASRFFNNIALDRLIERVQGAKNSGDVDKAEELVRVYKRVEVGTDASSDLLDDMDGLQAAFEDSMESIVVYPGALKTFFGDTLVRDSLVSFAAPEKRSKSFWLIDMAWRGMQQRKRVAFFAIGDLSKNQMMRRFGMRSVERPRKAKEINCPVSIKAFLNGDDYCSEVEYEKQKYDDDLTWTECWEAFQKVRTNWTKSNSSYFKLSCHPAGTISVEKIQSIVERWQHQYDWTPDVIVIDYADLLMPPSGHREARNQINDVWTGLRGLSTLKHCLVVTATQTNRASYKAGLIGMEHSSEDKRKLAHVNAMLGINQTSEEKDKGVVRLNWIVLREDDFSQKSCVHVAGCLAIANPALVSCFVEASGKS